MKTAMKLLSFILSFVLIFSCFSFAGAVFAEQSGIFIYRVEGDQAVLTGITDGVYGEVVVPEFIDDYEVVKIDGAFKYQSGITSVVLPDTVLFISAESFAYCSSLTNVVMPANLESIGESAFCACISLDNVVIPDSIVSIGQYAFAWCEGLKSIRIPAAITRISRGIFNGCVSLNSIELPDNITYIEQDVFSNTGYYNDDNNWENGALYIGPYLLKARDNLTGCCDLRDDTRLIAENSFINCKFSSIIIHSSLKTINKYAFSICPNLTDIYYTEPKDEKRNIFVSSGNYALENAMWHYSYDPDVKEYAPGDINGDDAVNNKDALRLFKYLSEWQVDVIDDVLDVNQDGSVDNKDLTRLMKYLSGWNVKIYSNNTGSESGGGDHGPIVEF